MEQLQEIVNVLPALLTLVCQVVGGLCFVATGIARITRGNADDVAVGKVVSKVLDILQWLPTIGVNPKTKVLEEEIKSLRQ